MYRLIQALCQFGKFWDITWVFGLEIENQSMVTEGTECHRRV